MTFEEWGIIGLALIGLEILEGSFFLLWFGISALCVAGGVYLFEFDLNKQLFIFAMTGLISALLYHKFWKKADKKGLGVGQSEDGLGSIGKVVDTKDDDGYYKVRFNPSFMGDQYWKCLVEGESVEVGATVSVVAIEGNTLRAKVEV